MLQDEHGALRGERLGRRRRVDPSALGCLGAGRWTADGLLTGLAGEAEDRVVELILGGKLFPWVDKRVDRARWAGVDEPVAIGQLVLGAVVEDDAVSGPLVVEAYDGFGRGDRTLYDTLEHVVIGETYPWAD